MGWTLALVLLVIVAGCLLDGLPGVYRQRACQGRAWRQAFPDARKQDIRAFLALFAAAFAFRRQHRLKFRPDDQVLAIYRALYPSTWTPDALELETLAIDIERSYGVNLVHLWRDDLTLGELFSVAHPASREPTGRHKGHW